MCAQNYPLIQISKVGKRWQCCNPDMCGHQLNLASQPIPAAGIAAFCNFSMRSHLCDPTETSSCSSLSWVWHVLRAFSLSFAKITGLSYLHGTLGEIIFMPSLSLGAQAQQNQSPNREQKHTNDLLVSSRFCTRMDCPINLRGIFCWDARLSFYDIAISPTHVASPLNFPFWLLHRYASY